MPDERISADLRRQVIERAHGCCEYCQSQASFATQAFSVEHILPRSKGGETVLANVALSCQGCNNHKYTKTEARDPVSKQIVQLYHPRQHAWQDHFAWNTDYTLVIGLTPTGRATVTSLQLNRVGLLNLRRVLYAMGEHPPTINGQDT
jgi:hypothetical protein